METNKHKNIIQVTQAEGKNMSNLEIIDHIESLVAELPKTHSMVIELRYLKNWSYANIAECMRRTKARILQIERSALKRLAHPRGHLRIVK